VGEQVPNYSNCTEGDQHLPQVCGVAICQNGLANLSAPSIRVINCTVRSGKPSVTPSTQSFSPLPFRRPLICYQTMIRVSFPNLGCIPFLSVPTQSKWEGACCWHHLASNPPQQMAQSGCALQRGMGGV
jgi:hypothetical protein